MLSSRLSRNVSFCNAPTASSLTNPHSCCPGQILLSEHPPLENLYRHLLYESIQTRKLRARSSVLILVPLTLLLPLWKASSLV
jgi:hypothetical protein